MPGLAVVRRGPDLLVGRGYGSVLRVSELNAGNVTGENRPGSGSQHKRPVIAAIDAVIQRASGTTGPDFESGGRYGAKYRAGVRRRFVLLLLHGLIRGCLVYRCLIRHVWSSLVSTRHGGAFYRRRGDAGSEIRARTYILPSLAGIERALQRARGTDRPAG